MKSYIVNEHLRNAQILYENQNDKWDDEKHESARLKLEEKIGKKIRKKINTQALAQTQFGLGFEHCYAT